MDFKTRYLTESKGTLLKGALLGAGAMMLGDHFSDSVHDFNNEMNAEADKGNWWNSMVGKAQGGLEHFKTEPNTNMGLHNPNAPSTDKLHDITQNNGFATRHSSQEMIDKQNHQSALTQKDQNEIIGSGSSKVGIPSQTNTGHLGPHYLGPKGSQGQVGVNHLGPTPGSNANGGASW